MHPFRVLSHLRRSARVVSLLCGMLALSSPGRAAIYYVDYEAGADTNNGTSTASAWKHCPGDPAAVAVVATATLTAGDTVQFKGGVSYLLTGTTGVALRWNGAAGSPITYDGNSSGSWGVGRARFSDANGANGISAFFAAAAASNLAFKNLEFTAIGGSAMLPADGGAPVPARYGAGIAFPAGVANSRVEACVFRGLGYTFNQKPMDAAAIKGAGISLRSASGLAILNCQFGNVAFPVDLQQATTVSALEIANCTFSDAFVWSINMPVGLATSGMKVYGCTETPNQLFARANWTGYGDSPRVVVRTVAAGGNVTLSATAIASPAATYQWSKNGTSVAGATSSSLTLNAVSQNEAGTYTIAATNSAGTSSSNEIVLIVTDPVVVNVPPTITTQPLSQTAAANSSVTFTAAASGTPAPTYQWLKNGQVVAGATNSTLTLPAVTSTDMATYSLVATNVAGTATSNGAVLTVTQPEVTSVPPVITTQPLSQTAVANSSVAFTAAASGTPAPTYQWLKNGQPVAGATSSTFTLSAVTSTDMATYSLVATNVAGTATSNGAVLTVTQPEMTSVPPAITTQPVSQTSAALTAVTFSAAASGTPAPTYQWLRNGIAISGATNSTLTLSAVTSNDIATYVFQATNVAGTARSNGATLTLTGVPSITSQPQGQTVTAGSNVTFSVGATGSPAPTYQWLKNGTALTGATNTSLTLSSVGSSDAGTYSVIVRNVAGSATSNGAVLTVNAPSTTDVAPSITTQPASQTVLSKAEVTFSVTAIASPAPTYQWRKDGTIIAGATNASYAIRNASKGHVGAYSVVVSNRAGSATSNDADLVVQTTSNRRTAGAEDGTTLADSRLVNLSVRSTAGAGDESLIVGFVVRGDSTKSLLVRGVGPSLDAFGVTNSLPNPSLSLYSGTSLLGANEDWGKADNAPQIAAASVATGAFELAATSADAALLTTVETGAYTAQLGGAPGMRRTALVEVYDAAPGTEARLVNVSVRSLVSGSDSPVIGFVVRGTEPKSLLIRAAGPTLRAFGISNALSDPQLEVYHGSTLVDQNDNWGGSGALTAAFQQAGAFGFERADSRDAALIIRVAPGAYTAVVTGATGSEGIAVVEVYELPEPAVVQ